MIHDKGTKKTSVQYYYTYQKIAETKKEENLRCTQGFKTDLPMSSSLQIAVLDVPENQWVRWGQRLHLTASPWCLQALVYSHWSNTIDNKYMFMYLKAPSSGYYSFHTKVYSEKERKLSWISPSDATKFKVNGEEKRRGNVCAEDTKRIIQNKNFQVWKGHENLIVCKQTKNISSLHFVRKLFSFKRNGPGGLGHVSALPVRGSKCAPRLGSRISSGWVILFFRGQLLHPIHPSLSENDPGELWAPSLGIPQIEQSKTLMKRENSFPFIWLSEIYLEWPVPELYYIKKPHNPKD